MLRFYLVVSPLWFVALCDLKAALLHSVNGRSIDLDTVKSSRQQQNRAALYDRFSRIVAPLGIVNIQQVVAR